MGWGLSTNIRFRPWCITVLLLLFLGCTPTPETHAEAQQVVTIVSKGDCPQVRKTPPAPKSVRDRINPVTASAESYKAGKKLYQTAQPLACKLCHGEQGNGKGDPDFESTPPARNFTCSSTMDPLSDGQLFWIIRNGSPGTSMPAFSNLPEEDVWKLVHYIREFSKW